MRLSFQTIRLFLAAWKRYLTLLGFQPMDWMVPVGMFTSLSSELAVAMAPLEYRLAKGLLYQNMTIRELQVRPKRQGVLSCHVSSQVTCPEVSETLRYN